MSVGTFVPAARPRSGPGTPRERTRALLADPAVVGVAALTVLAALLRFYRLGHQGFWFDEANTALLVHFSPGKMLGLVPQTESTPPLYYCVAWAWARVFGYGETALRSLSAVAGVLTVPVAYGAARKLISVRAGLIAAALTACSPLLVWYSQEARAYALLVLLCAASLLAFAHVLERPTGRWAAAWVLASALALATHYYAVLLIVPEALWLLAVHRRDRAVQVAFGLVTLCGLALIPLAISQHGTGKGNWISGAPLGRRTAEIFPQFAAGFTSVAYSVLEPLALALAIFGLALLLLRSSPGERVGGLVAGSLVLAGLVVALLLVAGGFDDLLTRNVLPIWMPAAIAVAGGFAAARARLPGLAGAVALCGIGVASTIAIASNRAYERPDWRGVAGLLGTRPAAGGRAILIQHYRDLLPLSLYLPRLKFAGRHVATVSELDVVSFTSPVSAGFCWWGSACNLWPSRMQASYSIPGFKPVWRRRIYQFTVLHMVAVAGRARVSGATVWPAVRTTRPRNDELLIQR
ncbi:MAG TPA: glycosyltransferase family 39 protein [Solirubrobacteraceae bacterium]